MIAETSILLKAADSILGWLGLLRKEQLGRGERERRAIKALYIALNETNLYFRRLDRPHLARSKQERKEFQRNIRAEEALSRLWIEASVELRDINPDLADRCFLKGTFWADRDQWSDEDVQRANITLQKVVRDARAFLRN
ncbi:MAG TPA: hypothetical protein VK805_15935 [Candidatus Baltobacteraceae bacterium]|jgi:hypothetical protein|nr:hypothetical protein [Candidatus Baltobacteraceae bacterium]